MAAIHDGGNALSNSPAVVYLFSLYSFEATSLAGSFASLFDLQWVSSISSSAVLAPSDIVIFRQRCVAMLLQTVPTMMLRTVPSQCCCNAAVLGANWHRCYEMDDAVEFGGDECGCDEYCVGMGSG
ncbi:Hypothetical predicted protein [Olea europaea subsp. europaea]|uniref:Uncharacterized protein n=1 Tax=Olea europaea subsp. europaea TaxID=158383 RepID=A0A8S0URT4_OLEEU|nr:Hypothetical predicted protein [Olea europaea subsp. europaea]